MTDEQLLAAFEKVNQNMAAMKSELTAGLAKSIADAKEEMLEHIHGVGADLHTQFQAVAARLDARTDRQGGLIQAGSRAMARLIEWSERADGIYASYDRRLDRIESRVDKLEPKDGA